MKFDKKGVPFFVAKRRRGNVGNLYIGRGNSVERREVVDRCRVPVEHEGEIIPCGTPFFEDEPISKREAHLIDCCRRNHDTIMAVRAQAHPAIMDAWDPELETWVNKHADAILEGRKRI